MNAVAWRGKPLIWLAGAALFAFSSWTSQAETAQVNSIQDVIARLRTCWKPPPAGRARPGIDITVIGEVVSGMDVVDKLKKAPPGSSGGQVTDPDKMVKVQVASDVK